MNVKYSFTDADSDVLDGEYTEVDSTTMEPEVAVGWTAAMLTALGEVWSVIKRVSLYIWDAALTAFRDVSDDAVSRIVWVGSFAVAFVGGIWIAATGINEWWMLLIQVPLDTIIFFGSITVLMFGVSFVWQLVSPLFSSRPAPVQSQRPPRTAGPTHAI